MPDNRNRTTIMVLGSGLCAILVAFVVNLLPGPTMSSPWHTAAAVLVLIVLLVVSTWIGVQRYSRTNARDAIAPWQVPDAQTRERAHMLTRVRHDWIDGLLNKQLHQPPRLDVQFVDTPQAIERPIDRLVQNSQEPRLLPIGTSIAAIFEANIGQLLILGAPGSGKTTQLLELTQVLLHRAQEDVSLRIPVVFNLSTWAGQRRPLLHWLAAELHNLYQVPHELARTWVDEDQILPLLDGLDEVAPAYRETCVHAINAFHKEHGLVPLLVCCRSNDYFSLSVRLRLLGSVEVQLPTQQQVEHHIRSFGDVFRGLQAALERDPILWRFMDSPLMLRIGAHVYHSPSSPQEPTTSPTYDSLFAGYVDAMLAHRAPLNPSTGRQVDDWLAWLGYSLALLNQRVFHLENLDQGWLRTKAQQRMLDISLRVFIAIMVFVSVSVLMMSLMWPDPQALATSILWGSGSCIVGIFIQAERAAARGSYQVASGGGAPESVAQSQGMASPLWLLWRHRCPRGTLASGVL